VRVHFAPRFTPSRVRQKAELVEVVHMNRFSTLDWIWCLTLVLSPAFQAGRLDVSADTDQKLREIVSVLRLVWEPDFDSNYRKYMLGSSSIVTLIPREEMIKIADARLDGRRRDGKTTQGLSIDDSTNVRIVVVYDDIAPLLVAKTIMHEIGHLELTDKGLSRSNEEARVRKTVDTSFFERVFGREWLEMTVTALEKKILPVEKNGRVYQGYSPDAVELFYQQLGKAGTAIERNPLHDKIVASMVFILTNSEKDLSSALDSDDDPD
jgi:hypothetical protein